VLEFCEKCEGRCKLIFVKKEYLIDIRKDKRSYCKVYLKRKQKVILLSKFKKKKKSKGSCCKCFKDRDMIPTQHLHSTLAWSGMGPHGSYPM